MISLDLRSPKVLPRVAMIAVIVAGCGGDSDKPADSAAGTATTATTTAQTASMDSGTTLLYTKKDPNAAAVVFSEILKTNPSHYGAHYQMAVALDSAGRVGEAKEAWEKFLPMAQQSNDTGSAGIAQRRLSAAPGALTDTQLMHNGLYLLYTKNDAGAAEAQFRELLKRNADHYGATYQLATALDRGGKAAEARPLWQKVLQMAQAVKDQNTINTAAARLLKNP